MAARSPLLSVVAGVLTVAAFGYGPITARSEARQPPPRGGAAGAAPANAAARELTPAQLARSGRALLQEHLGDSLDARRPRPGVRVCSYIAIVPDPIDSRLDWQFDAGVESVRRGFESSGFVLERFWLPWTLDADSTFRKRDRSHAPLTLRRTYPGVLLFRRASVAPAAGDSSASPIDTTVAIAYLVGETPTSGIHQAAFATATADRAAVRALVGSCPDPRARGADALQVIGPTFSGSIASLRRSLDRWLGTAGRAPPRMANVVSGGVTGSSLGGDMTRGARGRITFATTINPFSLLFDRLCTTVLDSALAYQRGEVAVLNESNTAFGVAVAERVSTGAGTETSTSICNGTVQVQFPMSISRLRAEYARHPASSAPAPIAIGQPSSRLPLDLQDPASSFESPPTLSDLTPAALERVMDDIAQTLLAHRVRAVVIVATDVRDRIFVANEVKRRLRDVRLVFIGAHTLYTRPEFNEQLRGALVVSTYPLFLENQYWTRVAPNQNERIVFSNELSEGAYNATLFQVAPLSGLLAVRESRGDTAAAALSADSAACVALRRGQLADYRAPHVHRADERIADRPQPPVWVTLIGRTTIAPIMAYPVDSAGAAIVRRGCAYADPDALAREWQTTAFDPWEAFLLLLVASLMASAAAVSMRPWWKRRRERAVAAAVQPDLVPATRATHARTSPTRHALNTIVCRNADVHAHTAGMLQPIVAVAMLAPLLLVPLRAFTHWWPLIWYMTASFALVMVVGALLATVLASGEARAWRHSLSGAGRGTRAQSAAMLFLGALYAGTDVYFVARAALTPPPLSAELLTRALQLGSGVTPIVPLVIGGAFLLVWVHQHLRRAKWLRVQFAAEAWREREAEDLRVGLIALDANAYTLAGAIVLAAGSVWIAFNAQRSPESIPTEGLSAFDLLHRALVIAILTMTTWAVLRIARTWRALQRELRELDAEPFIDGMKRLPVSFGLLARLAPLGAPTPTHTRTIMQTELDIRLRRLRAASRSAWERLFGPNPGRIVGAFDADDVATADEARRAARALAASFRRDHAFAWSIPASRFEDGDVARAAAEEVASIFAADYVTWIVRQLRHLAIGLLASVVLGTLFLSCYPFEPHTFVRIAFFSVTGVGIALVLTMLVQMNRDPVLSRLTRTTAGEVTWDLPFLANLAAIIGIPLVTLIGSQFPEVRDFLFGWLAPILRTVGRS